MNVRQMMETCECVGACATIVRHEATGDEVSARFVYGLESKQICIIVQMKQFVPFLVVAVVVAVRCAGRYVPRGLKFRAVEMHFWLAWYFGRQCGIGRNFRYIRTAYYILYTYMTRHGME